MLARVAVVIALGASIVSAPAAGETYRIGVLAFRGPAHALARWAPTAGYLSRELPGHEFRIVPLDLEGMTETVAARSIDFVLTNPGNYVELEARHGVSRIATLRDRGPRAPHTEFGAVLFAKRDRPDLTRIEDLRGMSLAAVSPNAFGGYQMAWRELAGRGIDPRRDLARIDFVGFPQDAIVHAVLDGRVDAGTVRSGVLERMAREGAIRLDGVRVLSPRASAHFSYAHSTRLYPEWPFAKLRHTADGLAQSVAVALLTMPATGDVARDGRYAGWTIPLDYGPVHELFRELGIGPYERPGPPSLAESVREHWVPVLGVVLALLVLSTFSVWVSRMNARIRVSQRAAQREVQERKAAEQRLAEHRDQLEQRVRERTLALERVNEALRVDIAARVRAEEALRASDRTLRRLHAVMADTPVDFRARASALLEVGREHFGAATCALYDETGAIWLTSGPAAPPADPAAARAEQGVVRTAPVRIAGAADATVCFAGGRPSTAPLRSVDEDIVRLIAQWIAAEIERARAQEEARRRQDELAHVARLGTLGEMATGLAHELNQPLTAIVNYTRGCVRRLRARGESSASLVGAMERAVTEAERAAAVVRGLREFVRKGEPQRGRLDVNDAVHSVLRMVSSELAGKGVELRLELAADLPPVLADPVQVEQVILNLVRNAVDSMAAVGAHARRLTIVSRAVPGRGQVELEVHDTGAGLSESASDQVFRPFFTTKPEGMGMGLSISRTIAQAHGGALSGAPAGEGGAVFTFRLAVDGRGDGTLH